MPGSFDSTNSPRSQGNVSTLKKFLEICLTLAKDHDALEDIEIFLYWHEEGQQDHLVNSLQKMKTWREMRVNV